MEKHAERPPPHALDQVDRGEPDPRPHGVTGEGKDKLTACVRGGFAKELLKVGVTADDLVQHHDVRLLDRASLLREVEYAPVGAAVEARFGSQLCRTGFVRGRKFGVRRRGGARAQQLKLDRTNPTTDLKHRPVGNTLIHDGINETLGVAVESLAAVARRISLSNTLREELITPARITATLQG